MKPKISISKHLFLAMAVLVVALVIFFNDARADTMASRIVRDHIQKRIEAEIIKNRFSCKGELICGVSLIPTFYKRRDYTPAWFRDGEILSPTEALIDEIRGVHDEGLRPYDYHLTTIVSLIKHIEKKQALKEPIDPAMWVDLDLLLTDAFMLYSSHLLAGRVNPETIHTDWIVTNPTADLIGILQSALQSNQIRQAFAATGDVVKVAACRYAVECSASGHAPRMFTVTLRPQGDIPLDYVLAGQDRPVG